MGKTAVAAPACLALACLALAGPAAASEPLSDLDARAPTLAVNARGEALVTYRRSGGRIRRVLVWGAVDARTPDSGLQQVRFRYDYAGGWGKYRRAVWRTFRNRCRPYDGPPLPYLVAACTAPDGSYWALQRWQRSLPLLGFEPWLPAQRGWELHVSHWGGGLAELDVSTNWTYDRRWEGVFGRLRYGGEPVYGHGSTAVGNPTDRYGRNVYVDTFDSSYGPGWRRETGILVHSPNGTFCHSFVPQRPPDGYPTREIRDAAPGKRYRVTVAGPGVTPVIAWESKGLGPFTPGDADDERTERRANELFDEWMAGDERCAPER
jgi:hypothetical protein